MNNLAPMKMVLGVLGNLHWVSGYMYTYLPHIRYETVFRHMTGISIVRYFTQFII